MIIFFKNQLITSLDDKFIIIMLSFLDKRVDLKQQRRITRKPYITFGVSIEGPPQFQKDHSMVSTHISPFNSLEPKNTQYMPKSSFGKQLYRKTDITRIEDSKVIGSDKDQYDSTTKTKISKFHENHQKQYSKNSSRFRFTRGQFTNYLQKTNSIKKFLGAVTGEERSLDKAEQTKRTIRQNSIKRLEKSKQKLLEKSMRKDTSRYMNQIIDMRRSIRKQRTTFYETIKIDQSLRKSRQKPSHIFNLPKVVGRQHKLSNQMSNRSSFGLFNTIDEVNLTQWSHRQNRYQQ